MADRPDRGVHAAALAGLPGCGPACLDRLLAHHPAPVVWSRIRRGDLSGFVAGPSEARRTWPGHARSVDLDRLRSDLERNRTTATTRYDRDHPGALVDDVDPAPVLFRKGVPIDEQMPAAAIVGTRRCSPTGRELAEELGFGLAKQGVVVVSGLALGIDGAAHRGALRAGTAPPVAVVGSGLDVVYPARNERLWRRVVEVGTLLSEAPLGTRPEPWRFPARNRLIAALADVVLVVESKVKGGSMITVDHAIRRGRPVLAVPGSVRNKAAAGTNLLISEGCQPVCGVEDVLMALGLANVGPGPRLLTEQGGAPDLGDAEPADLGDLETRILRGLGFDGDTLDMVAARCETAVGPVAAAVVKLEQRSLVSVVDGRVRRRAVAPPGPSMASTRPTRRLSDPTGGGEYRTSRGDTID